MAKRSARGRMGMMVYSALLAMGAVLGSPWWMGRMLRSARYRAGFAGRLGAVPRDLREVVQRRRVIWVHAVSVGEVLAAEGLIRELRRRLPEYVVVISTTTAAGQAVARERLGRGAFYFPLDFAFAVRRYLRVLRPSLVMMMESELWPRLLVECGRLGVPVAVVNARISDRSFPRYMRLRGLWRPLLERVSIFLAQGEESAERLRLIGARVERVRVVGNLKYDAGEYNGGESKESAVVSQLREWVKGRKVVVAGSTLAGEEKMLLEAWGTVTMREPEAVMVIAPRHPQRFKEVETLLGGSRFQWRMASSTDFREGGGARAGEIILLDTIGDLAAVYGLATVAFVGGSLVPEGGHNPLEPTRYGVPVVMGASYENFREIVEGMRAAGAIRIVERQRLGAALVELLAEGGLLGAMGERGRQFFEGQAGATERTVQALLELIVRGEG